jgi:hypothetical protein
VDTRAWQDYRLSGEEFDQTRSRAEDKVSLNSRQQRQGDP